MVFSHQTSILSGSFFISYASAVICMAMALNSVSANFVSRKSAVLIRSSAVVALIIALIASTSFWDLGCGAFCAIKPVTPESSRSKPAKIDCFMKILSLFLKALLYTFLGGLFRHRGSALNGQRLLIMLLGLFPLAGRIGQAP